MQEGFFFEPPVSLLKSFYPLPIPVTKFFYLHTFYIFAILFGLPASIQFVKWQIFRSHRNQIFKTMFYTFV